MYTKNELACQDCELKKELTHLKTKYNDILLMQKRLEKDIKFAQRYHKSILPKNRLSFKKYEFYCDNIQTWYLGGDFYDVFESRDDRLIFYIADVSGHGLISSLLTIFLKQAVRGIAQSFSDLDIKPQEILKKLQIRYFDLDIDDDLYIGIMLGIIDKKNNTISISNAGHNISPIHMVQKTSEILSYDISGLPINNWFNNEYSYEYDNININMNKGDKLIFLTDGAIEAKDSLGNQFGFLSIKTLLEKNWHLTTEEIFEKIKVSIYSHIGKEKLDDDIAFVGISRISKE